MSTQNKKTLGDKIRIFWQKHDQKILTVLALILVAVVSFRAGQTHEKQNQVAKIDVQLNQLAAANPAQEKIKTLGEALERKGIDVGQNTVNNNEGAQQDQECLLVGSKNSDKYHLPSCQWAARIKTENRVCFSSEEDAKNKGYVPAKCCH